jgi:hypothetical protein
MTRGLLLGAGREAEVFEWGDGTVIKLYRPGFGGHVSEAAALSGLARHGVAPRLIDVVEHEGRTGLILQRLDGADMLGSLTRRPWRVAASARTLAQLHLRIHAVAAPPGLPALRSALGERIRRAGLPSRSRDRVLRILDALPNGERLCHGDFHPANVLVATGPVRSGVGGASVIDWVAATRGVPEGDHARTLLLLRLGAPLPGTPPHVRALIAAGRALLTSAYTHAYRRGSARPLPELAAWTMVNAAARLAEGLDQERPRLLGIIERAGST